MWSTRYASSRRTYAARQGVGGGAGPLGGRRPAFDSIFSTSHARDLSAVLASAVAVAAATRSSHALFPSSSSAHTHFVEQQTPPRMVQGAHDAPETSSSSSLDFAASTPVRPRRIVLLPTNAVSHQDPEGPATGPDAAAAPLPAVPAPLPPLLRVVSALAPGTVVQVPQTTTSCRAPPGLYPLPYMGTACAGGGHFPPFPGPPTPGGCDSDSDSDEEPGGESPPASPSDESPPLNGAIGGPNYHGLHAQVNIQPAWGQYGPGAGASSPSGVGVCDVASFFGPQWCPPRPSSVAVLGRNYTCARETQPGRENVSRAFSRWPIHLYMPHECQFAYMPVYLWFCAMPVRCLGGGTSSSPALPSALPPVTGVIKYQWLFNRRCGEEEGCACDDVSELDSIMRLNDVDAPSYFLKHGPCETTYLEHREDSPCNTTAELRPCDIQLTPDIIVCGSDDLGAVLQVRFSLTVMSHSFRYRFCWQAQIGETTALPSCSLGGLVAPSPSSSMLAVAPTPATAARTQQYQERAWNPAAVAQATTPHQPPFETDGATATLLQETDEAYHDDDEDPLATTPGTPSMAPLSSSSSMSALWTRRGQDGRAAYNAYRTAVAAATYASTWR